MTIKEEILNNFRDNFMKKMTSYSDEKTLYARGVDIEQFLSNALDKYEKAVEEKVIGAGEIELKKKYQSETRLKAYIRLNARNKLRIKQRQTLKSL